MQQYNKTIQKWLTLMMLQKKAWKNIIQISIAKNTYEAKYQFLISKSDQNKMQA